MPLHRLFSPFLRTLVAIGLVAALSNCGCRPASQPGPEETELLQPAPPDPLNVLVVGEPAIGDRLARQWSAQRDGILTISNLTVAQWREADYQVGPSVDLVVFPPRYLGELAESKQILLLSRDTWNSDGIAKTALLSHYRKTLVRYDNQPYGVPLGNPLFAMLYRLPTFRGLKLDLPTTWNELERALVKIGNADSATVSEGALDLPLAPGWAGYSLLARVAPEVRQRGNVSSVFDRRTMEPLITSEPFVAGLEQLQRLASRRSLELDPGQAYVLAATGQSVAAMTWPARGFEPQWPEAGSLSQSNLDPRDLLAIESLPGSPRVFDSNRRVWKDRLESDQPQVDLFGFSGLMVSVTSGTNFENSAWEFLQWVSDKQLGLVAMSDSPASGPYRASHLGDIGQWTGDRISLDIADEYGRVIENTHTRSLVLVFPRIPGVDQYFDALDEAVIRCIRDRVPAAEVLADAAKRWDQITDALGRDKQIEAMRREAGF